MAKVRLTIRPNEDTEVPEDDIPVLRGQGLLVEDREPSAAGKQAAELEAARQRAAADRAEATKAPKAGE